MRAMYDRIATLLNTVSSKLAPEVQQDQQHTMAMAIGLKRLSTIKKRIG